MPQEEVKKSVVLSNGRRMPIIGLGTSKSDTSNFETVFDAAIDAGYRLFDTATIYRTEKLIGNSLKKAIRSNKVEREDIFIITKLPSQGNRKDFVRHFCLKSLNDLQLEYVDLYLIHSPISIVREEDGDLFPMKDGKLKNDTGVDLLETWKELEKLVDEGLARSIGISNFNSEQIKRIYENARIKPAVLQVECHAYLAQKQLFDFCKDLNIKLIAYAPLGSPRFMEFLLKQEGVERDDKDKPPTLLCDQKVVSLAKKYKKTPAQILIRYLVQRGITPIPKSFNPKRIAENIQVFDFNLSDDDMDVLFSLDGKYRYFQFDFVPGMTEHPEFPFNIPF